MIDAMATIFGTLRIIVWIYFIAIAFNDILPTLFSFIVGIYCTFISSIFGIISTIRFIKKRKNVVLHTVTTLVVFVSILITAYSICYIAIPEAKIIKRSADISEIVIALELYKKSHSGELPVASNWCDLLINDQYVTPNQLTITTKDKEERNYALNINALQLSEIPDDIVLIFESGLGWNLVGGKELLVGDHYKGGCWVLFGDMSARYIVPEDFDNLRWE